MTAEIRALRALAGGVLAAVSCALAACRAEPPPNIIVIVADTLRADRLGSYGNTRGLTPFLDTLAERSFVFRNAYAQSSWTNPSVASLFTSRFQSQHGVISLDSSLSSEEITLAEVLKDAGYATGFFTPNCLLSTDRGYGQGFDIFRSYAVEGPRNVPEFLWLPRRAGFTNQEILFWLENLEPRNGRRPPYFLYVQYMEPHSPYAPVDAALEQVLAGREKPDLGRVNRVAYLVGLAAQDERTLRDIEDVYDAEVLSLDMALGRLFAQLEARGLLENTLVVFTADHGDEFNDHGSRGHKKSLFNEVIRVPLLISPPWSSRRTDVEDVVSLVDLGPTLLDLIGHPAPAPFEGRSLLPLLGGRRAGWSDLRAALWRAAALVRPDPPDGVALSELMIAEVGHEKRFRPHVRSVVVGTHKLIAGKQGQHEFYDLAADPGERNPDALDAAERALLREALERMHRTASSRGVKRETIEIDEATRAQIRALGYGH